ncbi:hypothetical protein GGI35DRAFT_387983 [Trichoderma velutinum]
MERRPLPCRLTRPLLSMGPLHQGPWTYMYRTSCACVCMPASTANVPLPSQTMRSGFSVFPGRVQLQEPLLYASGMILLGYPSLARLGRPSIALAGGPLARLQQTTELAVSWTNSIGLLQLVRSCTDSLAAQTSTRCDNFHCQARGRYLVYHLRCITAPRPNRILLLSVLAQG